MKTIESDPLGSDTYWQVSLNGTGHDGDIDDCWFFDTEIKARTAMRIAMENHNKNVSLWYWEETWKLVDVR